MSVLHGARQVVLVSCRGSAEILGKKVEKDNIMALDWHMPTSFQPQMYAISVGKQRFSAGMISKSKCFAVNFMPAGMQKEIVLCGTNTGARADKFKLCSFSKLQCSTIDCPRIKEAIGYLECEVVSEIETGDHIIFVAKVSKSELLQDKKRLYHVEGDMFTTTG